MAVSLDLTQSGSATTKISAAPGDTVTFLLASAVKNDVLASALAAQDQITRVTGVELLLSAAGNGAYALTCTQAGSATTAIDAIAGDTITLELASTVKNDIMAALNTYLYALANITGVKFAINTAGGAT